MTTAIIPCCCGRQDCVPFQTHQKRIQDLENDAALAGQLGQALLVRHETYVAESERDRRELLDKMECLENEKRELELKNASVVDENRNLLDQLESLNANIAQSDSKVHSLTGVLHSTERELQRISTLASRTDLLQQQIAQLEDDLEKSNNVAVTSKEEQRAVILKWQESQRIIIHLNTQIEKIEREAREDRDRHAEVMDRFERRKAVELELLAKQPAQDHTGGKVVSHFVKDILADNANLQLGIMELRELLDHSNNEVERLRDQLLLSPHIDDLPSRSQTPGLGAELTTPKELHVHHHYHAPAKASADAKKPRGSFKRPKKRRGLSGQFSTGSPSACHTPRSSISFQPPAPTSETAILSQTSVTIPRRASANRWSVQSTQTGFTSSCPSSPYGDSIFDRVYGDIGTDISRPSSPDSTEPFSPRTTSAFPMLETLDPSSPARSRFSSEMHLRADSITPKPGTPARPIATMAGKTPLRESISLDPPLPTSHFTIPEELEPEAEPEPEPTDLPAKMLAPYPEPCRLRHSTSHESLISISGMDIHTLRTRPSQLLLGKYNAPLPASPSASVDQVPVLADRPSRESLAATSNTASPQSYLSSIAGSHLSIATAQQSTSIITPRTPRPGLGGWIRSRWGVGASPTGASTRSASASASEAPTSHPSLRTSAAESLRAASAGSELPLPAIIVETDRARNGGGGDGEGTDRAGTASLTTASSVSDDTSSQYSAERTGEMGSLGKSPNKAFLAMMRSPGINQPGPIWGFRPERRLPREPVVKGLDLGALREGLEGE